MTLTRLLGYYLTLIIAAAQISLWPQCAHASEVDDLLLCASEAERDMRYADAESLFTLALVPLERGVGSSDKLIRAYMDLAAVCIRLCRYNQAQDVYDRALLLARTRMGQDAVARVTIGLARLEHIRGNYGKSERLFRSSITMLASSLVPNRLTPLKRGFCFPQEVFRGATESILNA